MNQQPGMILLPRIKNKAAELAGLFFVLLLTGQRYAYQGSAELGLLLAVILIVAWIIVSQYNQSRLLLPNHSWAYLPIILSGILAVIYSTSFESSIPELMIWLVNLLVFLAAINIKNVDSFVSSFLIAGLLFISWKIPELLTCWPDRLAHPNTTAAFINILLVVSLAVLMNSQANRLLAGIAFALGSIVLLGTFSRGGLAAGVVGICAVIYASKENDLSIRPGLFILAGVLAAGAGIFVLVSKADTIIPSLSARFMIWARAMELFGANPLMGSGLHTFHYLNSGPGMDPIAWIHPHNIILSILSQMGIVGLLSFSVLIVVVLFDIFQNTNPLTKTAAIGALATMMVHGLLDLPYYEPFVMRSVLLIVGLSLAPEPNCQNDN